MDPHDWLCENAQGYSLLDSDDRQQICSFLWLWSLFEMRDFCKDAKPRDLCEWPSDRANLDFEAYQDSLSYFKDRYFSNGEPTDKYPGLRTKEGRLKKKHINLIEDVLSGREQDESKCVAALLLIVYRIRNNLFHGEKWPLNYLDQKKNFYYANEILMAAMTR